MGEESRHRRLHLINLVLWTLLCLLFLNVFGPFTFRMPNTGLDSSWQQGINQAITHHMAFGHGIVFTYGPYAYLFTRMFDPALFWQMSIGSIWLCVLYAGCLLWLTGRFKWPLGMTFSLLIMVGLLSLYPISGDVFSFSLSLMVVLCIYKLLAIEPGDKGESRAAYVGVAVLFLSLGVMPLIKGTLIITTTAAVACSLALMVLHRRWYMALIALICPPLTMCLLWIAAGQRLVNIGGYFHSMSYIVAGFSTAMPLPSLVLELVLFIGISGLLLHGVYFHGRALRRERIVLLTAYVLYLFMAFKQGFVRSDIEHIVTPFLCVAIGGLLLTLVNREVEQKRFIVSALFVAFLFAIPASVGLYQAAMLRGISRQPGAPHTRPPSKMTYLDLMLIPWKTLPLRLYPWRFGPMAMKHAYDDAYLKIRQTERLSFDIKGDADLYTFEQAALFANHLRWNPRPVFQSYSAYTPQLIEMNEQHLRTVSAPQNIIFQLQTIDHRLPALADGMSWPAMLDNYALKEKSRRWDVLVRRKGPLKKFSEFQSLGQQTARLGEEVRVPTANGPVYTKIDISLSIVGKAVSRVYKVLPLVLKITKANGKVVSYRVVSGMMKTGFILSPVVTNNLEFANLFTPGTKWPADQTVKSIVLDAVKGSHDDWSDSYTVSFQEYNP